MNITGHSSAAATAELGTPAKLAGVSGPQPPPGAVPTLRSNGGRPTHLSRLGFGSPVDSTPTEAAAASSTGAHVPFC